MLGRWLLIITLLALVAPWAHAKANGAQPQRAVELFELSAIAYREGRFDEAARLLREAYRLNPAPTLKYNLARALEGLGDLRGAIESYRSFLELEPNVEDRPSIEQRLATLERLLAEKDALVREREVARAAQAAAEARRAALDLRSPAIALRHAPSKARQAAPWILVGAGAATLLTGGVLGGLVITRKNEIGDIPTALAADEKVMAAERYATGANICFGLGGALALAGGVWGIVDLVRHRHRPGADVHP